MKSSVPESAQCRSWKTRSTVPRRGQPLEERAPRAEQLVRRDAGPRSRAARGAPISTQRRSGSSAQMRRRASPRPLPGWSPRRPSRRARPGPDHLAERPERDRPRRRRASGPGATRLARRCRRGTSRTPRPAGSCRCRRSRRPRRGGSAGLGAGRVEEVLEEAELDVAADEGRFEGVRPAAPAALGDDPDGAPGRDRRDLALEESARRRPRTRSRREAARNVASPTSTVLGRGGRLEARRRVHEVARDHALVRARRG